MYAAEVGITEAHGLPMATARDRRLDAEGGRALPNICMQVDGIHPEMGWLRFAR